MTFRTYIGTLLRSTPYGYALFYQGEWVHVPNGFKSSPSLPSFLVNGTGVSDSNAALVARGHDWLYNQRLGSVGAADGWMFDALAELGHELSMWQKYLFQLFSWLWWIT